MNTKKRVTFILSGYGTSPVGGFKIVYEYANRLSGRGWHVNVVHPLIINTVGQESFADSIKTKLRLLKHRITGLYLPKKWFNVTKTVNMLCVKDLDEKNIPDADYIVACPVQSAAFVNGYSLSKGKKFYFIQHFEDWVYSKEEVEKTWKYPLKKIVIAKWLRDIAQKLEEKAVYIPNGLDFSFFNKVTPFEKRVTKSVCFMSHELCWKGTKFALDALLVLKERYPEISVKTFSVYPKPYTYPEFIEYHCNPTQNKIREIFNSAAIFISPSLAEGWPLPPAEAMMCGCVVIATDIGGHREYIEDGINGFFCKPGSGEAIIEKVEYVFSHPDIAQTISENAPESLKKFDWDSRTALFEKTLLET